MAFYIPNVTPFIPGNTGSSVNEGGGFTYDPNANPYLQSQTETTLGVSQNTVTASLQGAQQLAASLGGQAVQLPNTGSIQYSTPQYGIRMPDGRVIEATAVANIIGNDAAFPNQAMKMGEIAKLTDVSVSPEYATPVITGQQVVYRPGVMPSVGSNPTVQQPTIVPQTTVSGGAYLVGNKGVYRPGDSYQLVVTGKPNSDVVVGVSINGGSPSSSRLGRTDSNGNFTQTGSMPDQEGVWNETYVVGGVTVGNIQFQIQKAPVATQVQNTTTNTTNATSGAVNTTPVNQQAQIPTGNAYIPSSVIQDFWVGLESLFRPSEWTTVFQSGNTGEILGLLAIPVFGAYLFMKRGSN